MNTETLNTGITEQDIENLKMSELESKIGEQVKNHLAEVEKLIGEKLKHMVWQACNDYVEYAEFEPLANWKDRERADLVGSKYMLHKESFWGKQMRQKLFEEHKDEILMMIKDEQLDAMQKEIDDLKLRIDSALNRRSH